VREGGRRAAGRRTRRREMVRGCSLSGWAEHLGRGGGIRRPTQVGEALLKGRDEAQRGQATRQSAAGGSKAGRVLYQLDSRSMSCSLTPSRPFLPSPPTLYDGTPTTGSALLMLSSSLWPSFALPSRPLSSPVNLLSPARSLLSHSLISVERTGCSCDLMINILLTILGYIPGAFPVPLSRTLGFR
jgi:hypothetical protein